ncbi:conserved hypothetical protein [Theileria equi strain WA]|uniref:H/ACA ribonucleoprotein complex subunit n=1 Tax=Theileria equi strain WA TaxID=1537102 RepID=L1LF49_THEEQ|nr:conserved hypothetical protein [Theileria equi strain WA]EKX73981.1 conserved hypothetical protein [Theileria equi strain WA]|eukprot:XP_004833433.1 conserved hypothetical protein [Theileria equi strain WA]
MKEDKPIVIDGVTEVDDLALVTHFAQTETHRIKELESFKKPKGITSQRYVCVFQGNNYRILERPSILYGGDESDASDSDLELEVKHREYMRSADVSDIIDPLDNLRIIDTVDLPEKVDISLPISKIGTCQSSLGNIVVVESIENHKVLDLGSIVCKDDRTILGTVNDTFGPTQSPFYMVILRDEKVKVQVGQDIYYDVHHSTFVTDESTDAHFTVEQDSEEEEEHEELTAKKQSKLKQSYKDL